jgi:hypothetical protein
MSAPGRTAPRGAGLLRAARKLVLGETWTVPLGIAATIAVVAAGLAALGPWFDRAGGFVLLAGALATLLVATRG